MVIPHIGDFILITFLAAFLIEGLGTAVSVIGLSTLFGANPIIIALAISLDVGKLVVVSLLYNHWKRMGVVMKSYAVLASLVTMIITSAGAAGYLTGEFQKAILGTQETSLKVNVLKEQQAKYEERKKQINFSDMYYNSASVIIGPKGGDHNIAPEAFKGKSIGVQGSTTHANYTEKYFVPAGAEMKTYKGQDEANADLAAGRDTTVGLTVIQPPSMSSSPNITASATKHSSPSVSISGTTPSAVAATPGPSPPYQTAKIAAGTKKVKASRFCRSP